MVDYMISFKLIISFIVISLLFSSIGQGNTSSISDYITILVEGKNLIDNHENNSGFEEPSNDGSLFDLSDLFGKGSFSGYSFLYNVISFLLYFVKKIFPNNPILQKIGL